MVRKKILKWKSEVKRHAPLTAIVKSTKHCEYILRRFNAGGRTYGGWLIKNIPREGYMDVSRDGHKENTREWL